MPFSFKRYRLSPQRLFLVPCDTDDADSNRLPTSHSLRKGQTKWKGRVSEACPPAAAWSGLRRSGWWGLNISTGSLFQLEKHLTSSLSVSEDTAAARYDKVERKGGHGVGFCPQSTTEWLFFFPSSFDSRWMQFLRTLGELINYKAGWVSKVNDLIIFPASLLRSQLSGSGKWGCGPLWCLRAVCV